MSRIVEHEAYNVPTDLHNDIALMFLTNPLTFGTAVQPTRLPEMNQLVPAGTLATVSGWGHLEYWGTSPEILQVVTVPIVDWEVCARNYIDINPVTEGMICSGARGDFYLFPFILYL